MPEFTPEQIKEERIRRKRAWNRTLLLYYNTYNEIDVTYIKEPHEEFIKFYLNMIQEEMGHV